VAEILKITGGEFCGRLIQTPKDLKTRPTQARLRQALFNSLQTVIPGARVLDLFAGSGALGFEALSRGAESVVFVETSRTALKLIEKNAELLGVKNQVTVLSETVKHVWSLLKSSPPFDLVLADPPYEDGWEDFLLSEMPWNELLTDAGYFCLEWGIQKSQNHRGENSLPDRAPCLVKVREKNYGDSVLTSYRKES